ncbi:WD repeat-containing protein 87 isoform X2 [Tripterygium wilfordii]|uniref:WD repeat-containing protein 87 isoform X2 n=1 Tax=Tripterygium wilfordii TaxID=458696 RepID=UPI0018F80EEC|nr:WD repeat-containing protein 87 isoform X2 [Tripterygium wilfordii]
MRDKMILFCLSELIWGHCVSDRVRLANRAVEMNEMWRVRQKERELNDKHKGKPRNESCSDRKQKDIGNYLRSESKRHAVVDENASASCSSGHEVVEYCYSREDDGLRDKEIEEFLHSRVKRGRGAVGSRMDETGPYLPPFSDSNDNMSTSPYLRERAIYGPDKPSSLNSYESSEDELEKRRKRAKRDLSSRSNKKHCRKHKSKHKSREKEKKRKEKRRHHK